MGSSRLELLTLNLEQMKLEAKNIDKPKKQPLLIADVIKSVCPKCDGKGWYFVNEWIGSLQGRKDCKCKGQTVL